MFSSVLVNYVPDTETGHSNDYFWKVECLSPTPFLNAQSEAGAKEEKSGSGGKGNLYIAASLQFSVIAFNYSWIVSY